MCGISGFLSSSKDTFLGPKVIKSMTSSLRHRGPDNENNWIKYEEKKIWEIKQEEQASSFSVCVVL